jgi:hypothetical protein
MDHGRRPAPASSPPAGHRRAPRTSRTAPEAPGPGPSPASRSRSARAREGQHRHRDHGQGHQHDIGRTPRPRSTSGRGEHPDIPPPPVRYRPGRTAGTGWCDGALPLGLRHRPPPTPARTNRPPHGEPNATPHPPSGQTAGSSVTALPSAPAPTGAAVVATRAASAGDPPPGAARPGAVAPVVVAGQQPSGQVTGIGVIDRACRVSPR